METDLLYTYQSDGKVIESNYSRKQDGLIYINTKEYDRTKDLIIDPYIGATYYGGGGSDDGESISVDNENNILITGITGSSNFPLQNSGGSTYFQGSCNGRHDVIILKLNSRGVRQWATYYGGSYEDLGTSITKDVSNNIFVTGFTNSIDLPLQRFGNGAYFQEENAGGQNIDDIFILRFNSQGIRQWATYYGGSCEDRGYSITSDGNSNILVTGRTSSSNFPLHNPGGGVYFQSNQAGHGDIFVLKFNSSGILHWATYYGGDYGDNGYSIVTDGNNNILLTGITSSINFPLWNSGGGSYFQNVSGGSFDIFILKFNSQGIRQWATYYGGNDIEHVSSIATDVNNSILITGETESTNFPLQNPGGNVYFQNDYAGGPYYGDAFILKFTSSGVRHWATYYGGSGEDLGYSITTDGNNNILITGRTSSSNFPLHNPGGGAYYQGTLEYMDAFILKFNSIGVRQWATYYGGNYPDIGNSITTDQNNNILVTGKTLSVDFPVFDPTGGAYFQHTFAGGVDAFILGFDPSGIIIDARNLSTSVPDDYKLFQNYPNPFNPKTKIKFQIAKLSDVELIVYNALGLEVATLVNEILKAGTYEVDFDTRHGGSSSDLPSGVYLYTLITETFKETKKMLMIK